jgi:Trypsin
VGLYCAFVVCATAFSQTEPPSQHFLLGGTAVPVGELEAVGQEPGCTATLIGPSTVLTAAHCVCTGQSTPTGCVTRSVLTLRNVRPVDDPSTTADESINRQDISVEGSVKIHPGYTSAGWASHDFALILLDRAASRRVANVVPISVEVPSRRPSLGEQLTLVGFGMTGDGGCNAPSMGKRRITLPLFEISTGNVTLRIGRRDMGACPGDSGGPALNASGKIVGVASSLPGNYDPTELAYNFISGFESLGGDLASGAAVAHTGAGRLELFIRGQHNDELVQRSWDGTSWGGWKNLGGELSSAPVVVHTGSGRLEVFIRGKHNDELVQRSWDGSKWSGWKNLGGSLASAPTVVHTGSGRLEVFVHGKHNDELVQRSWNGTTWSGWKNLGGDLASAPAAVHTRGGRLEVFVRGKHNHELVHRSWDGTRWSGWKNLGGDLASAPAVVHVGSGRLEVFVRGQHNDQLVQRSWDGAGWGGWKNLGGDLAWDPAVVHSGENRIDVFIPDKQHELLHRSVHTD